MAIILRLVRFVIGLLLIPLCIGVTRAAMSLSVSASSGSDALIPPSAWALGGGFLGWLAVFFLLPRPVRTYVLAHELTHALWAKLMGAKVLGMRVSKESGSVTLSKTNFLVTLAPYFFPLYTVMVILLFLALSVFYDMGRYVLVWLALVGLTWGFHFTFTLSTLLQKQSDIRLCGHLFSYTVIYLLNVLGICLWIVLVSDAGLEDMLASLKASTVETAAFVVRLAKPALRQ